MSEELEGNMKCTCTEVDEYGWHDEDCLLIKNKINLIDLDKIEEELKQFAPENTLTFQGVRFYSDSMMDFCKKSPERIAALVNEVKRLKAENYSLESHVRVLKDLIDNTLKRGSDEV